MHYGRAFAVRAPGEHVVRPADVVRNEGCIPDGVAWRHVAEVGAHTIGDTRPIRNLIKERSEVGCHALRYPQMVPVSDRHVIADPLRSEEHTSELQSRG